MKSVIFAMGVCCLISPISNAAETLKTSAELSVKNLNILVKINPKEGFMKGGWGALRYICSNKTPKDVQIIQAKNQWVINGKNYKKPWTHDLKKNVPAGKKSHSEKWVYFSKKTAEKSRNNVAQIKGELTYKVGNDIKKMPYLLDVKEAVLASPLKRYSGKYVSLNLTEASYDGINNIQKILACMDKTYEAMMDLTGYRPYNGANIEYKECPKNVAWAYAGNPIVLNTSYVRETLVDYSKGIISFGWTHELGHDFDNGIGKWYGLNGAFMEYQANIKLAYAFEKVALPRSYWFARLEKIKGKPVPHKLVRGAKFVSVFYYGYGSGYLRNKKRDWKTMTSDDFLDMNLRIVRKYGWPVMQGWYAAFHQLKAKGYKPPKTSEEKIALSCAIFSEITGKNFCKYFQNWKLPVTEESIAKIKTVYPVEDVANGSKNKKEGTGKQNSVSCTAA